MEIINFESPCCYLLNKKVCFSAPHIYFLSFVSFELLLYYISILKCCEKKNVGGGGAPCAAPRPFLG
jgi:hypothetical protein